MRRWYNRGKSIYQGGEEEDGRDHPARAFCDPGRPPSRTNEAPSVIGNHHHRVMCGHLWSGHLGGCRGVWACQTSVAGDFSGLAECAFLRMIRLGASLRAWTQSRGTACFLSWVQAINAVLPAKPLAIDGKTARRSHERAAGRDAIQMVSAWAAASHLVLAQRHVAEHSNEKTALPFLLDQLDLVGCIVSIDAMGCHAKIARQIKEQDGEYVLALKANQGTLYQDVVDLEASALTPQGADLLHDYHAGQDKGHGRVERRQYWTIADPEVIAYLNVKEAWSGLRSVGMEDGGAAGGGGSSPRDALLRDEPGRRCSNLWKSGSKPMEHRKWSALGPRSCP